MKKVDIITRSKDRPAFLARARESITKQTFSHFVWVIVNDAGDQLVVEQEANTAKDKGYEVLVLNNTVSRGMEAASNLGINHSHSQYIAIHDDDDSWEPEFLQRTVEFLDRNPNFVGVVTQVTQVLERINNGKVTTLKRFPYNRRFSSIQLADMCVVNQFPPISFVFRRSLWEKLGGFDESLPVLGDWDFNLRALMIGDIGVIPTRLANYHVRDGNQSPGSYGNTITGAMDKHLIYEAVIRNRALRADLSGQKIGLGILLFVARLQTLVPQQLAPYAYLASLARGVVEKLGLKGLIKSVAK